MKAHPDIIDQFTDLIAARDEIESLLTVRLAAAPKSGVAVGGYARMHRGVMTVAESQITECAATLRMLKTLIENEAAMLEGKSHGA